MIPGRAHVSLAALLLLLFAGSAFAEGVTLPAFHRFELDNGTVLLLSQAPEVPLVSVTAILRGGAVADPPERSGLANLLAALLEKVPGIETLRSLPRPLTRPAAALPAAPTWRPLLFRAHSLRAMRA